MTLNDFAVEEFRGLNNLATFIADKVDIIRAATADKPTSPPTRYV